MNAFLWTLLALFVWRVLVRYHYLRIGKTPALTPDKLMGGIVLNLCLTGWVVYLLNSSSS